MIASISADIELAAHLLRSGGVVAIPTETVYGLAADARNAQAVQRVFTIKGRPADHPLIVHLADAKRLTEWAVSIPESAYRLASQFWPGPLTLILKKHPSVPAAVTGGQDTIALRVPHHPLTLALLHEFGGGLAAPSANRFGRISPTTPQHVTDELGDAVDLILDGGACTVGVESTILNLTSPIPTVLRPGQITLDQLRDALSQPVELIVNAQDVRAPGLLATHYAPRTPLFIVSALELWAEATHRQQTGEQVAVMSRHDPPAPAPVIAHYHMPMNAPDYAQKLYATLREMDAAGHDVLLVEGVPNETDWEAVADRLQRAAVN